MKSTTAPVAPPLTDWIPCTTPPVREGDYQCVHETCANPENSLFDVTYKDGKWYGRTDGYPRPGVNRNPHEFRWRGVRRWVLAGWHFTTDEGRKYQSYLVRIQKNGVQCWSDRLQDAISFEDESAAMAYTRRRTRSPLGEVKAVQP